MYNGFVIRSNVPWIPYFQYHGTKLVNFQTLFLKVRIHLPARSRNIPRTAKRGIKVRRIAQTIDNTGRTDGADADARPRHNGSLNNTALVGVIECLDAVRDAVLGAKVAEVTAAFERISRGSNAVEIVRCSANVRAW